MKLLSIRLTALICIVPVVGLWTVTLNAQAARGSASLSNKPAKQPGKMLILNSGRIIEGKIFPSAGGYLVKVDHGSMMVPFEQVRFEADDIRDAYRKLRSSMGTRTASRHIALARWCLSHNLVTDAEKELRDALILEPHRQTARSMLSRLKGSARSQSNRQSKETDLLSAVLPEKSYQPVQSLAGLTRASGKQYLTRVQPILLNKCGNASCHGKLSHTAQQTDSNQKHNPFQLVHVMMGRRSHRADSERNLAQVLKQINSNDPLRSPLLKQCEQIHGGAHRSQFAGARGAQQLMEIKQWIARVAQELKQKQQYEHTRPSVLTADSTPASPAKQSGKTQAKDQKLKSGKAASGDTEKSAIFQEQFQLKSNELNSSPFQQKVDQVLSQQEGNPTAAEKQIDELIEKDQSHDAFDPARFNRLVHGIKSETE